LRCTCRTSGGEKRKFLDEVAIRKSQSRFFVPVPGLTGNSEDPAAECRPFLSSFKFFSNMIDCGQAAGRVAV